MLIKNRVMAIKGRLATFHLTLGVLPKIDAEPKENHKCTQKAEQDCWNFQAVRAREFLASLL